MHSIFTFIYGITGAFLQVDLQIIDHVTQHFFHFSIPWHTVTRELYGDVSEERRVI
jgi:hypothetical protein